MSEPVAWAVAQSRAWEPPLLFSDEERARRAAAAMDRTPDPLYRSPTLTDAEREAVQECYEWAMTADHRSLAATLRGLLERP